MIHSLCPTSNTEEAEQFYEDLQDLLELTPQKMSFSLQGTRMSRNTWSNRQIWPCSTEWSRAKANRVLPRVHPGHSKHRLPTTQEKTLHMDITRWPTLKSDDYLIDYLVDYLVSKSRPGPDCGSDHELLIAKFRLKLKKVGKTTRPFKWPKSNP